MCKSASEILSASLHYSYTTSTLWKIAANKIEWHLALAFRFMSSLGSGPLSIYMSSGVSYYKYNMSGHV